jgi:peptidoglycan/xylan/chitin deacetylase (PgdA/CDA1 family)
MGDSPSEGIRRSLAVATSVRIRRQRENILQDKFRFVVYTADLGHFVRRGVVDIDRAIPEVSWLIVLHTPRKSLDTLLRNQWRNFKRNGWRWIPYQTIEILNRLMPRKHRVEPSLQVPGYEFTEAGFHQRRNIRILKVNDIHASSVVEEIRNFDPQLGLSLAAPILKPAVFTLPKLGTLNLHKGKLPEYRGMPPAFWELWNEEQSVGCTVHWVEAGLDSGAVVREASVHRERYSSLRGLQLCLDVLGVELMRDAVLDVISNLADAMPQTLGGHTYRKPTLTQQARLNAKLGRRQPTGRQPTRLFKAMVYFLALWSHRLFVARFHKPRVTVLLYHRVSDDARDNLTVGIEQFDRQMALLRKHCHCLSIEEVITNVHLKLEVGKPIVCVTFDDGYEDNYLHAAPILLKQGIPAAFFVSTGIVGTNLSFPHDVRRGNPPLKNMNWEQLKRMRELGFTVGSHSVSHIDCAAEVEDLVRWELEQSLSDLRRKLGVQRPIFAYPYGGRANMAPARLDLVREAGYVACLSAYGGVNEGVIDSFNVLRGGIHWEFSDLAFLCRCEGIA